MSFNAIILVTTTIVVNKVAICKENGIHNVATYRELSDHTLVTNIEAYPYVVALIKKTEYLCAGALINDMWVITSAEPLITIKESLRTIRVRLGSANFREGGMLIPLKYYEIHPNFDDNKPAYDVALVMLAKLVMFSHKVHPINILQAPKNLTSHLTVTSWFSSKSEKQLSNLKSKEAIKRLRMLSVARLHPMKPENCSDELDGFDIADTGTIVCLENPLGADPCTRHVGAPVTQNKILWGVVSSWVPDDCDFSPAPSFAVKVSAKKISSWIKSTIIGRRDEENEVKTIYSEYYYEADSSI